MPFTPYEAASHTLGRARELLAGAQSTGRMVVRDKTSGERRIRPARLPADVRSDMRRLSVVMAVAALDTYMHRLIVERVYTHDELPKGLARLDVTFEQLLAQADETAAAARSAPHNSRPRVGAKRQLRDRLLRETFQSFDSVSRALAMAGRRRDWTAIGAHMTQATGPAEIRTRLNDIVLRRNQIVHEGDYERLEKPRGPRRNNVTHRQASEDIEFLTQLIDAIHGVV